MNKYLCAAIALMASFIGIDDAKASKCVKDSYMCVENEYNEWVSENGRNSEDYQFASASVKDNRGSFEFPSALMSAYQQALINALSEIAKTEFLRQSVEIYETHMKNDEDEPETPISSLSAKFKSIRDKIMAWTEGTLDNKLMEMGIDPKMYSTCPVEQKKIKFLDEIKTRAIERASATTGGFLPVQTFVACDEDGQCAVGVAVSLKEQTLRLINNITRAGSSYSPESGRKDTYSDLKKKMDKKEDFSTELGVRMVYDAEGYPVFVAFGQAGVSKEGGKVMQPQQVKDARRFARQVADSYLSVLFNSSVSYEQIMDLKAQSSISTHKERDTNCNSTGIEIEEAVEDIITNLKSKIKTYSHSGASGFKPVYSWIKDNGQYKTVGEIVIWSPKTAKRGENLKNPPVPQAEKNANEKKYIKQDSFSNRGLNTDAYDF